MEFAALVSFLSVGFGLGVVHAFDPDHLAAVGGLASGRDSRQKTWRFALEWSVGHGAALQIIALCVFLLGTAIPKDLSHFAEQSVAIILIILGGLGFLRLYRGSEISGAHYSAPIVGLIHGTAGSAPLLALIPLTQISQPLVGLWYVLLFSIGVLLAMTFVGSALSFSLGRILRIHAPLVGAIQVLLALFSIILGAYLLISA